MPSASGPRDLRRNRARTPIGLVSSSRFGHDMLGIDETMKVQYLEIVAREVEAVCAAYASALNVQFYEPDAGLGGARTASLAGGGLVGIRAPLRVTEEPVVSPTGL